MKIQTKRNRKLKTQARVAKFTKGEELAYAKAELLKNSTFEILCSFTYKNGDNPELFYDITNCAESHVLFKTELSLEQYHDLLLDVIALAELCQSHELSLDNVAFEVMYVYFDPSVNGLRFIYVPANEIKTPHGDVNEFLTYVAENASFVCAEDKVHAEKLLDFLNRQKVFSLIDFKQFVDEDRGILSQRKSTASGPLMGNTNSKGLSSGNLEPGKSSGRTTSQGQTYDFIKAASGESSFAEKRASQTLAEQIVFDVADKPSGSTHNTSSTFAEEAVRLSDISSGLTQKAVTLQPCRRQTYTLTRMSTGHRFTIENGRSYSIGRSKKADIHIPGNTNISRIHATVDVRPDGCFICDNGSTNKTTVGLEELPANTSVELESGMHFKLADEEFSIQ